MSRPRAKRIRVTGTLVATGPLSVGGLGSDDIDLPLARDGRGRTYVPGTSLAGALRAWAEEYIDHGDLWRSLFGGDGERDGASRIVVDDAPIADGLAEEVWDGIGIDRDTGTAARGIKFDRAVLPRGATMPLSLTLDIPPAAPDAALPLMLEAALGQLLMALLHADVGLGAATSRGFGRVRLQEGPRVVHEDWSSRAGVLAVLSRLVDAVEPPDASSTDPVARLVNGADLQYKACRRLDVTVRWRPVGPLMVKTPLEGLAVQALPFVSGSPDGRVALTIPGSSIKGAFRSQAERIVRTVLGLQSSVDLAATPDANAHRAQTNLPLVRDLFGSARGTLHAQKGWLKVDTCYARNACPTSAHWRAVVEALPSPDTGEISPPSSLRQALDTCGLDKVELQHATHVAIDRWTGGALPTALFTSLEPLNVEWEPIRVSVHLDRLDESLREAAVALLLLLLRDMARQRVPLGHGAHRGFGWLAVEAVSLDVTGEITGLASGRSTYSPPALAPEHPDLEYLTVPWNDWIDTTREHMQTAGTQ